MMNFSVFSAEKLQIPLATVDSGFGGYFTAKALEKEANKISQKYDTNFTIIHYGDTLNAPYGEKTPDQIAQYASQIIIKAHQGGAKHVFLACNTASAQFEKIKEILSADKITKDYIQNTYSIIESSVRVLKSKILSLSKNQNTKNKKDIHLALLVTPATLKSDIYPMSLQKAFGLKELQKSIVTLHEQERWRKVKTNVINSAFSKVTFMINKNQRVFVYQLAPGNWVDMIEHQADSVVKNEIIKRDLKLLTKDIEDPAQFDVVAHFCTHFPVYSSEIKKELEELKRVTSQAEFIQQGEIFAKEFVALVNAGEKLQLSKKNNSVLLEPHIYITGSNKTETENLVKTIFPEQKVISVEILK